MAPMFPSGILSTLCLLSLRQLFCFPRPFVIRSRVKMAMLDISLPFSSCLLKTTTRKSLQPGINKSHQLNWIEFVHLYILHSWTLSQSGFFNNTTSPSFSYLGFKMTMDFKLHGKFHILLQISVVDNRIGYVLRAAGLLKLPHVQRLPTHAESRSKQLSCTLLIPPLSFSFLC